MAAKKRDYHNGVITKEEYVEWKLQWNLKVNTKNLH